MDINYCYADFWLAAFNLLVFWMFCNENASFSRNYGKDFAKTGTRV